MNLPGFAQNELEPLLATCKCRRAPPTKNMICVGALLSFGRERLHKPGSKANEVSNGVVELVLT